MIILRNVNLNTVNLDPSDDDENISFFEKVTSLKSKLKKLFTFGESQQKIGVDMQFDANRIRDTNPNDYSSNGSRVNLKPNIDHDTDDEVRETNRLAQEKMILANINNLKINGSFENPSLDGRSANNTAMTNHIMMMDIHRNGSVSSMSSHLPPIGGPPGRNLVIQGSLDISESDIASVNMQLAGKKKKKKKVKKMKSGVMGDDDQDLQEEIDKMKDPNNGLVIKPDGADKKEMEMKRIV